MRKGHDYKISNKVYNSLKRFSEKNDKQRQRLHEKVAQGLHYVTLPERTLHTRNGSGRKHSPNPL